MTYKLYWISGSPYAWAAMFAMAVKGLDFESHRLDVGKREHKSPEYLALNPRGKVPVLRDEDTVIYETIAVMSYLDSKHAEVPLFGANPGETGLIWQRVSELMSYIRDPIDKGITLPLFQGKAADEAQMILEAVPAAHESLNWINDTVSKNGYLAGASLSAADVLLMPFIRALLRAASKEDAGSLSLKILPLDKSYTHIASWLERLEAVPGYDATYPPHWRN